MGGIRSTFSRIFKSGDPDPDAPDAPPRKTKTAPLTCSFCGKSELEVRKLIAGPEVFICDECTVLCMDIISKEAFSKKLQQEADEMSLVSGAIRWPPDLVEAGMCVLDRYANNIIENHPDFDVGVEIRLDGNHMSLTITSDDGTEDVDHIQLYPRDPDQSP
jgi:hypothetical protein